MPVSLKYIERARRNSYFLCNVTEGQLEYSDGMFFFKKYFCQELDLFKRIEMSTI